MDGGDRCRRTASRADRPQSVGIDPQLCPAVLGATRNVHAALNCARFEMGLGKQADRVLQAAWNRSGVDGLAFEMLELVKEREDAGFDDADELKMLEQIHRGWTTNSARTTACPRAKSAAACVSGSRLRAGGARP